MLQLVKKLYTVNSVSPVVYTAPAGDKLTKKDDSRSSIKLTVLNIYWVAISLLPSENPNGTPKHNWWYYMISLTTSVLLLKTKLVQITWFIRYSQWLDSKCSQLSVSWCFTTLQKLWGSSELHVLLLLQLKAGFLPKPRVWYSKCCRYWKRIQIWCN